MAGNQLGKCRTYEDRIVHPDGTESKIGELFDKGVPFNVLSWDGNGLVPAAASRVIKKPAELCVEVFLSSGASFKASLRHVLLTNAGWQPLERLLAFAPILPESNSGLSPIVRSEGEGHWIEKALDWKVHYSPDPRPCGELLRVFAGADQSYQKRLSGAPLHNHVLSPSDFSDQKHTSSAQPVFDLPSSWYGRCLSAARSAGFVLKVACKHALSRKDRGQALPLLASVFSSLFQSVFSIGQDRSSKSDHALVSPFGEPAAIIGYRLIGVHDLYDLSVPIYGNYFADGVIHHNTLAGGAEWAMHLTGRYPKWWKGAVFTKAPILWAGSVTGEATRDNPQRILVGPPPREEAWGTGLIPGGAIADWDRAHGTPNLLDNIQVRWGAGGDVSNIALLAFKAYEKGREKWQGPTIDGTWFDEEPPMDIYTEGLTRTNNGQRGQFAIMTFTPLLGVSEVVHMFLDECGFGE